MGSGTRADIVAWLNARHPKPQPYDQGGLVIGGRLTAPESQFKRERDALEDRLVRQGATIATLQRDVHRAERERDEAVARAEKAERERDEADRRTAEAEADRDRWKLHHDRVDGQWAKAEREVTRLRATSAVSRADIEECVYGSRRAGRECDEQGFVPVHIQEAVDRLYALFGAEAAMERQRDDAVEACALFQRDVHEWRARAEASEARTVPAVTREQIEAEVKAWSQPGKVRETLFDFVCRLVGVEAEQAVDPVEAQTDALADILYGHETVTDQMRGVLERVVRAGMLFPEQEADRR